MHSQEASTGECKSDSRRSQLGWCIYCSISRQVFILNQISVQASPNLWSSTPTLKNPHIYQGTRKSIQSSCSELRCCQLSFCLLPAVSAIYNSLTLAKTHTHTNLHGHMGTHTQRHSSTQIWSCDNIRQHPPVSFNDSKWRGDIWRWRACVYGCLNVTEEITCMCECYECKPYYACVSPRGGFVVCRAVVHLSWECQ